MKRVEEFARTHITRTDPEIPELPPHAYDRWSSDPTRRAVLDELGYAARDAATLAQALAVHDALLSRVGIRAVHEATADQFREFIMTASSSAARHLRRNSLLSCELAKATAGRQNMVTALVAITLPGPITLSRARSRATGSNGQPAAAQTVIATNDEILALRMASRSAHSRWLGRPPASLALGTAGAGYTEGPQVRWSHLALNEDGSRLFAVRLAGVTTERPDSERFQATRTNELDRWEADALTAWQHEYLGPGAAPPRSVVYTGPASLTSTTAQHSYGKAILNVRESAGLDHVPGTTPGGIALWSAAHDLAYRGLEAAAARHGTTPARLLAKLDRNITPEADDVEDSADLDQTRDPEP